MKKVIYTCIVGKYDTLKDLSYIDKDYDYICFTDTNIKSDFWQIRPLPKEVEGLSNVKKQRYVKMNPHKVLSEYDFSLYIDGNIDITGNFGECISGCDKNDYAIMQSHPRDCIYQEAIAVIRQHKDKQENVEQQIKQYRKEGFPQHFGLTENNIIFRFHNEEDCIKLMEAWWAEYLKQPSCRDQLSLSYVLWKNKDLRVKKIGRQLYNTAYFKRRKHNKIK